MLSLLHLLSSCCPEPENPPHEPLTKNLLLQPLSLLHYETCYPFHVSMFSCLHFKRKFAVSKACRCWVEGHSKATPRPLEATNFPHMIRRKHVFLRIYVFIWNTATELGAELYAVFPCPYFLCMLYTYGTGQPYLYSWICTHAISLSSCTHECTGSTDSKHLFNHLQKRCPCTQAKQSCTD